ncbi:hypothetical protein ANACAC_00427 [Anaerostipes caccae L1-92]|uniref:Uncharacterized protein n=1 Tax=Anaerostipes caccae (strain DSM 14662 / CCUG 47493 / JCM 13470 / NCIMB 13811 / L1-92) TaxID=411490 RepID=B0MA53_ANACD|nr:hypothetical protein ANACAC_00427 [Anaerostipes caccae L1-92]
MENIDDYEYILVRKPASAVSAISNIYIWAPVIIWGAEAVILFFYRLDK